MAAYLFQLSEQVWIGLSTEMRKSGGELYVRSGGGNYFGVPCIGQHRQRQRTQGGKGDDGTEASNL